MGIFITTTGSVSEIPMDGLGRAPLSHPLVDYDISQEFEAEEIRLSGDLQTAIDNGWVTVKDSSGQLLTVIGETVSGLPLVTQVEAEEGTSQNRKIWSPLRVKQAIAALAGSTTSGDVISVVDVVGNQAVGSSWADVSFDTALKKVGFTHTLGTAEVTVTESGAYLVMFNVTITSLSSSSRTEARQRLVLDTGSGYEEVSGTLSSTYHRQSSQGENTGTVIVVLDLSAGDKLKVQAIRESGNANLATLPNGSRFTLAAVGRGPTGPQGPAGSGSSVSVKSDGTLASGTPHSTLNFVGFQVANVDGDEVTITNQNSGRSIHTAAEEGETGTASTAYQPRVILNFTSDGGTYEVTWYAEVRTLDNQARPQVRIQVDGATIAETDPDEDNDNGWYNATGKWVGVIAAGSAQIDMSYRAVEDDDDIRIRRARLFAERVSVS